MTFSVASVSHLEKEPGRQSMERRGSGSSAESSRWGKKPALLKVCVAEWLREVLIEGLRNMAAVIHCVF